MEKNCRLARGLRQGVRQAVIAAILLVPLHLEAAGSQDESKTRRVYETINGDAEQAPQSGWIVGGFAEAWRVSGDLVPENISGGGQRTGSIDFNQIGARVFVGYDRVTASVGRRSGSGTGLKTFPGGIRTEETLRQEDFEVLVRYKLDEWLGIVPYVFAGYSDVVVETESNIVSGGAIWPATGNSRLSTRQSLKSGQVGVSLNFRFTDNAGAHLAFAGTRTSGALEVDGREVATGSGLGGYGMLTGYVRFLDGWSLQLGVKRERIDGGERVGGRSFGGFFGMLGYSYAF